jgi:tryptophan synthase alpha chain
LNRISAIFSHRHHIALIPFLTIGYPNLETTFKAVELLASCGCDMVELGIPFSDPIADGVTIQRASYEALRYGVTPSLCLQVAEGLRHKLNLPLILLTYYNPVFKWGVEAFCRSCAAAGIDGLIIPDLPPEEGEGLETLTQKNNLALIYLLAPNSDEGRIGLVAQRSRSFIYVVSLIGVTGAREKLPPGLEGFINRVRRLTSQPLCVGFGISNPQQAYRVGRIAEGVIVGSRLMEIMEKDSLGGVASFIRSLRASLDRASNLKKGGGNEN